MKRKPIWLSKSVVLAIHDEQLAEHGGAVGLRDEGLLDSALQRPKNLYRYGRPDLARLAAAYGFGIVTNHPFVDGNKRVGAVMTELFLDLNGVPLEAPDDAFVLAWLRVASGKLSEDGLAAWLRENLGRRRPR